MKYRNVGKSGLKVSEVALGSWMTNLAGSQAAEVAAQTIQGSHATYQADKQVNNLLTDENLDKVERLSKLAEELGTNMSVLALAWILHKPVVSSVITGASRPEQLENNLKASGFVIPEDALQEIEEILGFQRFERHVG